MGDWGTVYPFTICPSPLDQTRGMADAEERAARQETEGYDPKVDLAEQVSLLRQQAEHVEMLLKEAGLDGEGSRS